MTIDGIINNGRCSKELEKIQDEVHRPHRRKRPPFGSSRGTQNESTWSGRLRRSPPHRRSLRSWTTYEPEPDPYCVWQKSTNENLNGLLKEFYPKGRNLSRVAPATLKLNLELINAKPRKVLNFHSAQKL